MDSRAGATDRAFWADTSDEVARRLYQALVDTIDEGVYLLDSDEQFVAVNDAFVTVTGYSRGELLGEHISLLLAPHEIEHLEGEINRQRDSLDATPVEPSIHTANGATVECVVHINLLLADGDFRGTLGVVRRDSETRPSTDESARTPDDQPRDVSEQKDSANDPEETESQFSSLVDAVSEYAIFRLDPDGTVATWNQGAKNIKGYDAQEILGEHFSTFYAQEDRAAGIPEQNLEQAAKAGSVEDEGWRVRQDGSRFWANVTITAIPELNRSQNGYLKVTRDMTERRENEQQLKELAQRHEQQRDELDSELDDIFDRVDEAFLMLDSDWHITYVNDHTTELVRLPEEQLVGSRVWDVLPEVADGRIRELAETAMQRQESVEAEFHSELLDTWFEIRAYPDGSGMSVYFRDITERKENHQELQRIRERMEFALNATDAVVWDWNVDDDQASFYPSAEGLYGTTVENWEDFIEVIHPEDRQTVQDGIERALETGESKNEEIRIVRDGDVRWIEAPGQPVQGDDGSTRMVGVARDITERKTYEHKLEESNARLEQFAHAASHDLQEPLRMVSSYLQLIESRYDDALDEDGREFLEFAVDGADRMRNMIDGLLAYSRIESKGASFEPVELDDVLAEVRDNLELMCEESGADISVAALPRVEGDRDQLRQLFQNLLDNAMTYSGDAPPRIHVSAELDGSQWVLSVRDEGVGIDPTDADRIFEVFQSLHGPDDQGSGIGLALCKRIVERHGGEIWVDSSPGEGATFSFTLPESGDDNE